jgi:RsiW-degrading membrane proteinase PrsW (M82 family)
VISVLPFPLALIPVLIFLAVLVVLDSFKLLPLRYVLGAILIGGVVAIVCYFLNVGLLAGLPLSDVAHRRYLAPLVEEALKAGFLIYLIRRAKVGFLVDSAIVGFAVGAGFAVVENINYLFTLEDRNLFLWIVRGFGTAIMHGSTVTIFAIVSKSLTDRRGSTGLVHFLPGLGIAFCIHSFFNHFFLNPFLTTAIFLVVMPLFVALVFERNEKATRGWLGVGFDSDIELLELVNSGDIGDTRVGRYLESLKHHFPGKVLGDLLCLLRIHLELSVRAKGILLAREAGMKVPPDELILANLEELRFLNRSVGPTGRLALAPFLNMTNRELWQLHMLSREGGRSRPRSG